MNRLWIAALAAVMALGAVTVTTAQVSAQPPADPGPPLSGYPRNALRAPTPAGLMADDGNPAAANPLERSGNRVAAVVAYYPPADMAALMQGRAKSGAIDFDDNLIASVSPILSVDARDPPTLILQGDADKAVVPAQAQAMHAALDKVRVENKLQMFAGADHDFYIKGDPAKTDAYCVEAMTAMVDWFVSHLKK